LRRNPAGGRLPSCSAATRPGGSPPFLPNCLSC
jgi:hypothetical protein